MNQLRPFTAACFAMVRFQDGKICSGNTFSRVLTNVLTRTQSAPNPQNGLQIRRYQNWHGIFRFVDQASDKMMVKGDKMTKQDKKLINNSICGQRKNFEVTFTTRTRKWPQVTSSSSLLLSQTTSHPLLSQAQSCNLQVRTFSSDANQNYVQASELLGIKTITLNNPKRKNCLSLDVISRLQDEITQAQNQDKEQDKNVKSSRTRAIVLRATGNVFSSGHDLKELSSLSQSDQLDTFSKCSKLMITISESPIPVIAIIDEQIVAAAGTQLIASCDIVLASSKSSFSTPGSNVGLFCSTPGVAVARSCSPKMTSYLLITGLPIDAHQAAISGLITKVYPDSQQLELGLQEVLKSICSKSSSVIAFGKSFLRSQVKMNLHQAYDQGLKVMIENLNHPDGKLGIESFFKKEKNVSWTHESFQSIKNKK